ncbi:MAG: radical SAM protein [Pyrobaculum sp.]
MISPDVLTQLVYKYAVRDTGGVVLRRYRRFRADRWYGGVATADVVGCNLRCGMCWAWRSSSYVLHTGQWMTPEEVAERLSSIAKIKKYRQVRVSGGEPLIAPSHLLKIINLLENYIFIVETNGLLIDQSLARNLARFSNIVVRVSLKGASEEEFVKITYSPPVYFYKQLDAVKHLVDAGLVPCRDVYPAAMLGFSTTESIEQLKKTLSQIHRDLPNCIDVEYVILYPHVVKLMKNRGITPTRAVSPGRVPSFMI